MDSNNWRAAQGQVEIPVQVIGGETVTVASMEGSDWRNHLQTDSRQRIVNRIMETLNRHLPFSGQDGLQELKKIAVRYEEKVYTTATSQSDYLRKISMKILTMEGKSHNPIANSLQSNAAQDPDLRAQAGGRNTRGRHVRGAGGTRGRGSSYRQPPRWRRESDRLDRKVRIVDECKGHRDQCQEWATTYLQILSECSLSTATGKRPRAEAGITSNPSRVGDGTKELSSEFDLSRLASYPVETLAGDLLSEACRVGAIARSMMIHERMHHDEIQRIQKERDMYKGQSLDLQQQVAHSRVIVADLRQQVADIEKKAAQELEEARQAVAKLQEDVCRLSLVEDKYNLEIYSRREFLASGNGTKVVDKIKAEAVRE